MFDRVRDIISVALARREITRYWLTDLTPESLQLPGGAFDGEIEAESGIIVTPDRAYEFWLGWAENRYLVEGKNDWRELALEETTEYNRQRILQLQQRMRDDPAFGIHEPVLPPVREPGKPTERERTIIWWRLAASRYFATVDLTDYAGPLFETFEVLDVQSGDHDLVGSLLPGEVQDISGIIVLAQGSFHFQLSWIPGPWGTQAVSIHRYPGRYSLGEKDGAWRPVLREECSEEQWQQYETLRHNLAEAFARLPRLERPLWTGSDEEIWPPDEPVQPEQIRPRKPREGRERGPRVPHEGRTNERTPGEHRES